MAVTLNYTYPSKAIKPAWGDVSLSKRVRMPMVQRVTVLFMAQAETRGLGPNLIQRSTAAVLKSGTASLQARMVIVCKRRVALGLLSQRKFGTFPTPYFPRASTRPTAGQVWPRLDRPKA